MLTFGWHENIFCVVRLTVVLALDSLTLSYTLSAISYSPVAELWPLNMERISRKTVLNGVWNVRANDSCILLL